MPDIYRRQLRNYLLDRRYQLRYTLMMVVITTLLTSGLGYIWYQQMRETSRAIEPRALASLNEKAVQQIKDEMATQDRLRLLVLVGFGFLFAVAVAGYGIVLTHKVAGPLFKIGRYMMSIKEGKLGSVYDLRRGDHLHEFFEGFKEMHSALRKEAEDDICTLEEVIASVERHFSQAGPAGVSDVS